MNWYCGVGKFNDEADFIFATQKVYPPFVYSRWGNVDTQLRPHLEVDIDGVLSCPDHVTAMDAILEYAYHIGIPWEEIEYAVEFDDGSWAMWKFAPGPEGDFHIVAWSNKSRAMERV